MKKVLFAVLAAGMVAAGCDKENIFGLEGQTDEAPEADPVYEAAEDPEDQISATSFDRTITITFSDGSAVVEGDENKIVSVDGSAVTSNNTTTEKVKYILRGSTSNGCFKLYSEKKQAIVLDGVSITNPSGAAINNQSHKRTFVVVSGSNYLADGATYSTPADEDEKAAFFSEAQLIFSGTGTLEVSATGKSGIASDDYIHVMDGPTLKVTSTAGHGIRGKDALTVDGGDIVVKVSANMKKGITSDSLVVFNGGKTLIEVTGGTAFDEEDQEYKASAGVKADGNVVFAGGELTITNSGQGGKGISGDGNGYFQGGKVHITVTGTNYGSNSSSGGSGGGRPRATETTDTSTNAKGIKLDGDIYISGGDLYVTAANHEAVEAKGLLYITGGTVYAQSKDDAVNSAGDMVIKGGHVCAYSTGNDGLDANGNLFMEGGVVYAIGSGNPELAMDANTEGGKKLYLSGGVLFAIGGLESGSSLTQSCYSASSWSKNTWYSLTVGGDTYCFKTPSAGGTALVVSAATKPAVTSGVTPSGGTQEFNGMAIFDGTATGGNSVSLSNYTSNSGGPGGGRW